MNIIKASITSPTSKIAIVIARFNNFINKNLLDNTIDTLTRIGKIKNNNITIIWVPGVYEIPLIINGIINNKKHDAIIALGTLIQGDTLHFKAIFNACNTALMQLSIKNTIPISWGIITAKNTKQAIERAGIKKGNTGIESSLSILEMINLLKKIKY